MNLANLSRGKPTATLWQKTRIFYKGNDKAYALKLHTRFRQHAILPSYTELGLVGRAWLYM
jgi:hypothetical protein